MADLLIPLLMLNLQQQSLTDIRGKTIFFIKDNREEV